MPTMPTKEYRINGMCGGLRICSTYPSGYKYDMGEGSICIKRDEYEKSNISLTINEAKELISVLNVIIDTTEHEPIIGDAVTILSGQFKGMTGRICDIDEVVKERELVVMMDKTDYNDEFYAYIDKNNVV